MAGFYDRFPIPIWIAAGVLAIFAYVAARHFLSGWPLLARRFRTELPLPAYASLASMTFRYLFHYRLDISCASDPGGLYLAFSPALGRARLFIPWDEIEFLPRYNWVLIRYQPLRLGMQERVRCALFAHHADRLLRDANRQPIEKIPGLLQMAYMDRSKDKRRSPAGMTTNLRLRRWSCHLRGSWGWRWRCGSAGRCRWP